jgi:membrane protease YdiL (CAAX protease family)
VWNGWDALLLAFLTVVTLILTELLTVKAALVLFYRHQSFRDVLQKPTLSLVGEALGYIPVAAFMIFLVEGKYRTPFWKAIKWNWPGRSALKWLGVGVLTVIIDLVGRYLPMPKSTPFEQFFAHPVDAYLTAAFAVTLGPFIEELFFRGFLYPVLAGWTGVAPAIVLQALPFGLLHYVQYRSWSAVLLIMLVGVVLGIVRAVTKSVGASFLVHVGYNGTLMTLAAISTDGFRHMEKAVLLPF